MTNTLENVIKFSKFIHKLSPQELSAVKYLFNIKHAIYGLDEEVALFNAIPDNGLIETLTEEEREFCFEHEGF
jgi:hypothetical protein